METWQTPKKIHWNNRSYNKMSEWVPKKTRKSPIKFNWLCVACEWTRLYGTLHWIYSCCCCCCVKCMSIRNSYFLSKLIKNEPRKTPNARFLLLPLEIIFVFVDKYAKLYCSSLFKFCALISTKSQSALWIDESELLVQMTVNRTKV